MKQQEDDCMQLHYNCVKENTKIIQCTSNWMINAYDAMF